MRNYITHSLKILSFVTISLLILACGPNTRQGPSEFANASQNLDSILKQADQAEPNRKNPLLVQASGILLTNGRPNKR